MPASRVPLPRATARNAPAPKRLSCVSPWNLKAQLQAPRELLQQPAIGARVERAGRQRGQPAREIVAGGGRQRQIELGQFCRAARGRCARRGARVFGLLLNVAKRNAAACSAAMAAMQAAFGGVAARSPAATPAAIADRHPARCARVCRPPAGARRCWPRSARHATTSSVCACVPTRRWKLSPALRTLRCEQRAQHGAVRQRLASPPRLARAAGTAGRSHSAPELDAADARADLAHRYEELVEGQASRHSVKPQGTRLIPCLTVKNQTPKIARVDNAVAVGAAAL